MQRSVRLTGSVQRAHAKAQIDAAEDGWIAIVKEPTRSVEQNAKMHAMLTDIANQKPMGWTKTPETWKAILCHACGYTMRFEMGLDGHPFPIGIKTSTLSVKQMSQLIEFMYSFGAEQGIIWRTPEYAEG
jgi:hypothetical protein